METLHSAHVAEYYYAKCQHAERHYFASTIALYRKLYMHIALQCATLASKEQKQVWACAH